MQTACGHVNGVQLLLVNQSCGICKYFRKLRTPSFSKLFVSWQETNHKYRQCVEKQRCYSTNKGPNSQGNDLPSGHVWLWELDRKAGGLPKSWCFRTVRRLLRVPWTARRSKQPILREINPDNSLEGLMLKLKLQYFGIWCKQLTRWKSLWCWARLRAEGEEGIRRWDDWIASPEQWTGPWANFRR